ncbi:hypothetical protein OOK29_25760 [Streptomyces phaeochromogenes]|uniref:hypothetical protein n=1 Tax=Streptomyces phaeochromogenes TaxID=1923 RepID=UPI002251E0E3|nr:hypothetical protein [Streptomyces phaeochromogenes]MCX5601560.1 hypothetical protein [Streptomyces phaeochromogenes]
MNLIDLATAAFAESSASADIDAAEQAAEAEARFLKYARGCVRKTLDEAAADLLDWQYIPADRLPDQIEEARALLTPGRLEYLRYRVNHSADAEYLDLVQPCRACDNDGISPVTSLVHLGQLLNEEDKPHDQDTDAQEPGPLDAVDAAERRAAVVAALALRLLAQHPDADLTVDTVAVFGHDDGDGSAQLRLKAADLNALRLVAAAMGRNVATKVSGTHPGMVFEHGDVIFTVDGTEVQLRAHTRLPDDEAAAWLAQQDQPEAAAGGDV